MMNIRGPREPVIFSQMMEALLRLTDKERFDMGVRKRLRDIGVDLDQPLLVAYSVPTWFATVDVFVEILHPTLAREQARYRIGQDLSYAYGRTIPMGNAVFQIFRMLGWRHSLPRITRGIRSGTDFLSAQTRFREDKTLEVAFDVLQLPGIDPDFMNGCLDAVMALMGAPFHPGQYQPHLSSPHRAVYVLQPRE